MESAIRWVGVFALAVGAEWKTRHGCLRSVVGDVFDDGEAWAAVGAVDEGIVIAAVSRVEEFAQTVGADGDVW